MLLQRLPILSPTIDNTAVMTPMVIIAGMMLMPRKANETPTARASMLVATAIINILFVEKSGLWQTSSFERDSRTILKPIIPSRINAIQWSIFSTIEAKLMPRAYPSSGIKAWKPPNQAPTLTAWRARIRPTDRPLHIDTAKASIARPIAIIMISM